jgi:hypothetical protein
METFRTNRLTCRYGPTVLLLRGTSEWAENYFETGGIRLVA